MITGNSLFHTGCIGCEIKIKKRKILVEEPHTEHPFDSESDKVTTLTFLIIHFCLLKAYSVFVLGYGEFLKSKHSSPDLEY